MKKSQFDTRRLFITQDKLLGAYFIRSEAEKFVRFKKDNNKWFAWIYPYKYSLHFETLKEMFRVVNKIFVKYWNETYSEEN